MDLRRLSHLVALADKRSFARAAKHAHLSQPAFSRSIQAAEAEWGLKLFDRGTKGVTLTPAGTFVLERVRQVLFHSASLGRDVELYRERRIGDIAFGAGPYPAATLMAPLLVGLRRDYPAVNVRVEFNHPRALVAHLRDEQLELVVSDAREFRREEALAVQTIGRQEVAFFCRAKHDLAHGNPVRLRDAWSYGVAAGRAVPSVHALLAQVLGLPPRAPVPFVLECDDVEMVKRVALQTTTVLAAPHGAVAREIGKGTLKRINVCDLPPLFSDLGAITLKGRTPSPMAAIIVERLTALAGEGRSAPVTGRERDP